MCISVVGQFLLVLVGPSAAASLLKCAVTASFRITLFAAGAAPDFISPSSSFVCFSLVGQTSGRALLRVTAPSYKSCVDKEQEMSFINGYKIQHPDIKVKQKMRFFFASIFMVFFKQGKTRVIFLSQLQCSWWQETWEVILDSPESSPTEDVHRKITTLEKTKSEVQDDHHGSSRKTDFPRKTMVWQNSLIHLFYCPVALGPGASRLHISSAPTLHKVLLFKITRQGTTQPLHFFSTHCRNSVFIPPQWQIMHLDPYLSIQ